MKRLFCTVVTDVDGTLESPIIYHNLAEGFAQVEQYVRAELAEYTGYEDEEELADRFDIFTFEVKETDIAEV
jgi:hypothetical protein